MSAPEASPASRIFATLVAELTREPGVEAPDPRKKTFGAGALKANGKIFAMVTSTGHFVVKLPRERVAELTEAGEGAAFDPGHGRIMKEWFQAENPRLPKCRAWAREALAFAAGKKASRG